MIENILILLILYILEYKFKRQIDLNLIFTDSGGGLSSLYKSKVEDLIPPELTGKEERVVEPSFSFDSEDNFCGLSNEELDSLIFANLETVREGGIGY